MSTRLVILGFLRGRPLYGYEIKNMIERIMGDWTNIAFGSIYFALRKLTEEGYIEKLGTEQEGSRPSRTVYQITNTGRDEFLRLLRQVWGDVERQYFAFDVGLSFMSALPIEEVKEHLRERVKRLEHTVQHVESHRAEQLADEHVPSRLTAVVFEHHLLHFHAELDWTRNLLKKVEQGIYDAELGWLRSLLEQPEPGGLA